MPQGLIRDLRFPETRYDWRIAFLPAAGFIMCTPPNETVLSLPHSPLSPGSAPPRLLERLVELRCPAHLARRAAQAGPVHIAWDIPYRGIGGTPKWAWAILHEPRDGSPDAGFLRVDAREFALVFSGSGELIRARDGARYLSGPERILFYNRLSLGAKPAGGI